MNSLKRKRTQQRREFTFAANAFEAAIHSNDTDENIEIAFLMLSDTADNLFLTEEAVKDMWCDDDDFEEAVFEADQDKALEYRRRWLNLKTRYRKLVKPLLNKDSSNSSLQSTIKSVHEDYEGMSKKRINIPKLDLVKFDGNVKNWLLFWGQFKRIHEDTDLEDIDKFQFLLQATVVNSNARHLVETYPPSGENYHKALEALKARFARDDVLIETYVRGLLNLVLLKQRGQTSDLQSLYDNLQTHLQALETLGVAKDKYASVLFPMIESALPEDILRTWNRIRVNNEMKGDDLNKLIQFLRQEIESEERVQIAREGFINLNPSGSNQPTACFISKSKTDNDNDQSKKPKSITCIWCDKENHASSECHKAIKFTLLERQDFLKNKRACTICLKPNHSSKKCKSFPKCLYCRKRHVTLMCTELYNINSGSHKNEQVNNTERSNSMLCQLKTSTVLQTLAVKIVNGKKEVVVRALIDSGSQRSYVRKDAIQKLNLKPSGKETMSHCLFGGIETKTEDCLMYNLYVNSTVNNFNCVISVLEKNELCGVLPKVTSTVIEQLRLKCITLTDVSDCPDEISILIGADFSGYLLTGEFLHLDNNLTAVKTKLGWTVQGPITGIFSSIVGMNTTLHCLSKIDITDLWSLESLGIRDTAEQLSKSEYEKEILNNFNNTISINDENRYEVCLPWRDNMPRPQSNYYIAKKRLLSTTARLENLGKLSNYDSVFQEWLKLNIIEIAPDQDDRDGGIFLPHHAVIKESSQTTKIRPVFDASAKDVNSISLNACLHKGSNLIELIPELLIDFRKEAIGVTADIAKAFLQISLNPDDRNYQKFLWWSDTNEKEKVMVTYRHRRVVFGVKSSPFHLAATINHHLENCPPYLKDTAIKLKTSFYVDNCVTSVDTIDSMQKFIKEAKEVMMLGNFNLRCWVTAPEKIGTQEKTISVLGIIWNTDSDTLSCNVTSINHPENVKITKRSLLSISQRIFDPIGVCCPATIVPKMILQQAWSQNTKWDEELPAELKNKYQDWMQDIHLISEIQIPRRLTTDNISDCKNCLHVFSDASLHAYSTCIFLRSECQEKISVSLVTAKSRVTPLKKITIPRLELIAATLATRMAATVIKTLNLPDCQVQYWTDSSVVLSWIRGGGDWSVFVTNRVREIKQSTNINTWNHVPGNMNPADLPSRGTTIRGLLDSRWWLGPSWLLTPSENWPTSAELTIDNALVDEERKRKPVNIMLVEENTFLDTIITYFSSYTKILRMISWMLRCKYRSNRKSMELTYHEIEYAEKVLFRIIQGKNINKLDKLQTFKDEDRLIRLETKLGLTNETFDFKSPIILPGTSIIVQRMIQERHRILQHAGTQNLMANIRETFWIIGIRKLVKKVVRDCVVCKRYKAKAPQTHRASLPQGRTGASSAFEVSGVDLAGPLILKGGSKCWIVLFTCATYRAVHLEITESLSTHDFISALHRFIARRGRVKQIYSDNGTNFTGFNNCLKSVDWNQILCFSSIARIKWIFIPPGAPWWGGFYERMVGVMKNVLRKVLGRASLTLIELQTVLCDCEATINNRPLTYITNSQDDLKALTPSMFIQPLIGYDVPDLDVIDNKSLNIRNAYCQKIREDLRRRFRSEYISNLIHKGKQHYSHEINVGDVVLLEIENEKRLQWPLAVVTEVCVGSDGYIRAAKVRTASGERLRPLQRLYPLEIPNDRHDFTERPSTTVTRSGRTVKLPSRFC